MLGFLTILIMAILGYAYFVEGLFTAVVMCVNVVGAGLVAFNFWEPVANLMDLGGYEDFLCLIGIFCLTLATLRTVTNQIANTEIEFLPHLQRPGGALIGLVTGYLTVGFLVCALQTLPWHVNFMLYDPTYNPDKPLLAQALPPDRVWLAMMHRAGDTGLGSGNGTFDPHASFVYRYARYRRYTDDRDRLPYQGEFDPAMYPRSAPAAGQ
jgi:hypothetical protein